MTTNSAFGLMEPTDTTTEFNRHGFLVEQALKRVRTIVLCKVTAVSGGGLGAPPTVDVQPLVNMVDGQANATQYSPVHGLPVVRIQSASQNGQGGGAIIADPLPGDIGIALIADRDSSAAIAAQGVANPGSQRRFNLSDGIYLGTLLGAAPLQALQFLTTGGLHMFDQFGNNISTTSLGLNITDVNGNTIATTANGIAMEDKNGHGMTITTAGGIAFQDDFGNIMSSTATGFTMVPFGSGSLVVQGNISATGNVFALEGGLAVNEVGLFTHTHSGVVRGTSNTTAPNPGT